MRGHRLAGVETEKVNKSKDNKSTAFDLLQFVQTAEKVPSTKQPPTTLPKGACYDGKGGLYVPWGASGLYQRAIDKQYNRPLVLYRRGPRRRIKTGERRNDLWDIELTINDHSENNNSSSVFQLSKVTSLYTGLSGKELQAIQKSQRARTKPIPVYRYLFGYSFTQVWPRKKVRVLPFTHFVSLVQRDIKEGKGLLQTLVRDIQLILQERFKYCPVYYRQDNQPPNHPVFDWEDSVPLLEIVRAVTSIYACNFHTRQDRGKFHHLVRMVCQKMSTKFVISTWSYDLGYRDISFADKCQASVHIPILRQIVCHFQPPDLSTQSDSDDLFLDETGWDEYSMDSRRISLIEWCEGSIDGADQFYRVNLDFICLKTEDSAVQD